jgi:hypothetical protein
VSKSSAIPVRLEETELVGVDRLCDQTGLSRSEILRRAVALMFREYDEKGSAAFLFERNDLPTSLVADPAGHPAKTNPVRYGRPRKARGKPPAK